MANGGLDGVDVVSGFGRARRETAAVTKLATSLPASATAEVSAAPSATTNGSFCSAGFGRAPFMPLGTGSGYVTGKIAGQKIGQEAKPSLFPSAGFRPEESLPP